jgi:hypothetical protein
MLKFVLLLIIGVSLALAAGGIILYRTLGPEPAVEVTQTLAGVDAGEGDPDTPVGETEPVAGAAPLVRRGAEGLGGSEGFTCVVEAGARRCRTSD